MLVPFTPGVCAYRDRSWAWVRARLEQFHPDWQIVVGTCDGPWSKGAALADAAARADGDLIVMHDADLYVEVEQLERAVAAVAAGAPWAVPHMKVYRLAEKSSQKILDREPRPIDVPRTRREVTRYHYTGVAGGGIAVLPRATWDRVPVDPRFVGWGGEDEAWGIALDALAGRHTRGRGHLIHLYHPQQETHRDLGAVLPETDRLATRYKAAKGDPVAVAAILEEVLIP